MNELHLFAGAGGGILGGILLGHTCVCAVEIEPYCRKVLLQRQRDGILPKFPIWDDVQTFDGKPWRGLVDVVSGGFPCQDISCAGKGAGINGARSGLWKEMSRIIGEVRPRSAFVENSPALLGRGLGTVLGDLAEMGYDSQWGVLSCAGIGGIHLRERIWIAANTRHSGHDFKEGGRCEVAPNQERNLSTHRRNGAPEPTTTQPSLEDFTADHWQERVQRFIEETLRWKRGFSWSEDVRRSEDLFNRPDIPQPLVRGKDDGMAHRMDRTSAIGNGQVPAVAALAWNTLNAIYKALPHD